ncbi:ribonuclease HI [Thiomicrorhabdus hydrogeniphila]
MQTTLFNQNSDQSIKHQNALLDDYQIYTDGGYFEKLDIGGWGFVIFKNDQEVLRDSGWQKQTSSLEMELFAAQKAIEKINAIQANEQSLNHHSLPENLSTTLFTDSKILIDGLTQKYPIWCANQWKVKSGKTVVYKELWQSLSRLCTQNHITLRWIKAHNGNPGNTRADSLAREAVMQRSY